MIDDSLFMERALEIAARGRGAVEPNPMVGAVLVRDGEILAQGWHQLYGGPHAEINALAGAGESARGATLYVTLEPCCHHGKTPPCTDAVIAAGISRVVVAMADPFPRVSGQGLTRLRSAGITVEVGLCEEKARRLTAPYRKLLGTAMPWVHAKWAMTLDGKIATRTGHSQWISNPTSRQRVHELRGRVDAVLVGIGTALADDPQLTARPPGPRTATRIVLDSQARLPLTAKLVQSACETPVMVATTLLAPQERRDKLTQQGCEVLLLPEVEGRPSLKTLLEELGKRRFTNILVEGGGEVLGSLLDADLIDEVHVFLAPTLIGGRQALGPIQGMGRSRIDQGLQLTRSQVEMIDRDVYLHGYIER